jgi:hypothetical protein
MRRYPVRRLPENPTPVYFENYAFKQPKPTVNASCPSPSYSRQNFSMDALINVGQLILVIIGIFFGIISSEVGGNIIPFQATLFLMFFLTGGWSFVVFWRLARFVGIVAWLCSIVLSWLLIIQPNLN